MTFESRAARAARSLRSSIAGVTPGTGFPALVRRRRLATVAGLAAMTILVAGAMAFAAILPSLDDETAASTIATTTVPTDPSTPAAADATTTTSPNPTTTSVAASEPTTVKPPAATIAKPTTTTAPEAFTTAKAPAATTTTSPVTTTTTPPVTTTKPPVTTTKPPAEHPFTANQTYGTSDAEPHTEILSGTGVPGTQVELWSPYATTFVTVAADGTWEGTLTFTGAPPGTFDFKARDSLGTKIWFTFTIEGSTEHPFTANQAYGTSSATPPYDLFFGTGTPGTTVQIVSQYGSGSVVVGDAGQWEITVEFPDAPLDTPFEVKAKDEAGTRIVFSFERTA